MKMFRLFEIMPFQQVSWISLNYHENSCERQSTCYQTVLRFDIWLKQVFSNSIYLGSMEIDDQKVDVVISAVIITPEQVDSPKVL